MKFLLLLLTILCVSSVAHAQCKGRVDQNSVMIFMDMNNSALEIAAAERAACARGQKLEVLPKNHREYNQLTNLVQNDMKAYERCMGAGGNCEGQTAKYLSSYSRLEAFKQTLPSARDQFRAELEAMKASGKKLVNFTISGHDGGGTYSGHKGEISRAELLELMKEFTDVNAVKSVLLLGCYTTVPNEVIHWKSIFPNGKLIAGYDGIAPASDKITGHHYLQDLLSKEALILKQADQNRLDRFLKANIRGLSIMNAGVYVELECAAPNKFFYGLDDQSRRMRTLDIKECDDKLELVTKIGADITRYYTGASEPPADTRNGELRRIYNQGRRYEHCGAHLGKEYSMSQAFNLLFYDGLKKNFAHYYRTDMNLAQQIIGTITPDEMIAPYLEAIKKLDEQIKEHEALGKLIETPEIYKAEIEKKMTEAEAIKNAIAPGIQDILDGTRQPATLEEIKKLESYSEAKQKAEVFLMVKTALETTPATEFKKFHDQVIAQSTEYQNSARLSMAEITSDPEKLKIWMPNAENLSRKSRKETLENIHKIETITKLPGLPPRKLMAMKWLHQVSTYHLQTMENPFSWHEYTGRMPERPLGADNLNLESWLKLGGVN